MPRKKSSARSPGVTVVVNGQEVVLGPDGQPKRGRGRPPRKSNGFDYTAALGVEMGPYADRPPEAEGFTPGPELAAGLTSPGSGLTTPGSGLTTPGSGLTTPASDLGVEDRMAVLSNGEPVSLTRNGKRRGRPPSGNANSLQSPGGSGSRIRKKKGKHPNQWTSGRHNQYTKKSHANGAGANGHPVVNADFLPPEKFLQGALLVPFSELTQLPKPPEDLPSERKAKAGLNGHVVKFGGECSGVAYHAELPNGSLIDRKPGLELGLRKELRQPEHGVDSKGNVKVESQAVGGWGSEDRASAGQVVLVSASVEGGLQGQVFKGGQLSADQYRQLEGKGSVQRETVQPQEEKRKEQESDVTLPSVAKGELMRCSHSMVKSEGLDEKAEENGQLTAVVGTVEKDKESEQQRAVVGLVEREGENGRLTAVHDEGSRAGERYREEAEAGEGLPVGDELAAGAGEVQADFEEGDPLKPAIPAGNGFQDHSKLGPEKSAPACEFAQTAPAADNKSCGDGYHCKAAPMEVDSATLEPHTARERTIVKGEGLALPAEAQLAPSMGAEENVQRLQQAVSEGDVGVGQKDDVFAVPQEGDTPLARSVSEICRLRSVHEIPDVHEDEGEFQDMFELFGLVNENADAEEQEPTAGEAPPAMEQGPEVKVEEISEQATGASQGRDGQPVELFQGGYGQAALPPHMRGGDAPAGDGSFTLGMRRTPTWAQDLTLFDAPTFPGGGNGSAHDPLDEHKVHGGAAIPGLVHRAHPLQHLMLAKHQQGGATRATSFGGGMRSASVSNSVNRQGSLRTVAARRRKLGEALSVMQECFHPIQDIRTKEDLIPLIVYSQRWAIFSSASVNTDVSCVLIVSFWIWQPAILLLE
jgi:hypothetical protein